MQFKIPKFGFKSKKRGNAAGFLGAKLSFISNHLSIISNKLSQNNHLSIINDKLSKKRINYKLSIFGKKLIINYKLLIAVGVLALAATGGTLALNGFFGGGAAIPEDTMTRGLAGYWSFDEGDGAIARDASGNNNHGTLTNGPQWTKGKNGTALQFDGKDDYVDCGNDSSLDITDEITIEAWVKFDVAPDSHRCIVGKNVAYDSMLQFTGLTMKSYIYFVASGLKNAGAPSSSIAGNWYHYVAVYNGTQVILYMNGVAGTRTDITDGDTIISNNEPVIIGKHPSIAGREFNGSIDEVRIYNRALTEAEVKYHYNRGGPVAQWDMDEGGGSVINDKSGNGNDGTIFGATWAQGKRGSALSFDGVDDYVNAGNGQSMDITDKITLSAWVNPSSWGSSDFPRIIVKETGVSVNSYALYVRKDNSLLTFVSGGNLTTTETIPFNQWTHITAIYDSAGGTNNRKIYFNGRLVAQNTGTSQINSTAYNVFIGNGPDNSRQWDGLIDEVKIYDYARTEEEIRLDYNAGVATHLGPSGKTCSEDPAGCMDFGLAGHWDMDEGNGSILNDKSGNNNHGTLANGPKWAQGKHGTALQFDGKDDYVDAGNGSSLNMGANQDFSIEAWVKYSNNPSYHIIAGKYCDINTAGYWLDVLGNRIRLRVGDGGGSYVDTVTTSNYNDNKWHHIMAIADRDGLAYIYIDGNQVKSNDISSENGDTGSEALSIGWPTDSNYAYFNGQIDEVKIYNRALSAEEVRYHYNQGKPVAQWDMDEGSGLVINDKSGNGNNGTLVNDTTWAQGKHGSALSFDGVDDYVSVPNSSDLDITADESFSYSLWLKTTSTGCASCHFLIKYGSDGYSLHINGGGIRALVNDSDEQIVSPSYQINDGIWHYVEVVFDRSTDYMTLYVDGTSRSRTNVATIGSLSNPQPLYLMHFSTIYFAGLIDEVKIYDYARTEEEIRLDYNAGLATHLGPSGKTCSEDPAGCMDYGLAGHWDMDEGNGSIINDKSGNNNHGTLINGPKWTQGKNGTALQFDGKDDYVEVGNNNIQGSENITSIETWFRVNQIKGYQWIVGKYIVSSGGKTTYPLALSVDPSGNLQARLYDSVDCVSGSGVCYAQSQILPGEWYHVIATLDTSLPSENIKLYINGRLVKTGNYNGSQNSNAQPYRFGKYNLMYYYNGLIDNMHIYNRALSAEEVRYHYNQGKPVAQWDFDEGEGTRAFDVSGNNNTGVLTNGPAWVEGKHGSALSFDGVDDSVSVANITNKLSPYTISLWLDGERGQSVGGLAISTGSSYQRWGLSLESKRIYSYNSNGTTVDGWPIENYDSANYPSGWHMITIVDDGTTRKFYRNGAYIGSHTNTLVNSGGTTLFRIGRGGAADASYFNGQIDGVKIYNYARTEEQIGALTPQFSHWAVFVYINFKHRANFRFELFVAFHHLKRSPEFQAFSWPIV